MNEDVKKPGDLDALIAALAAHLAFITLSREGRITVSHDTSARDALRAEMEAKRSKFTHPRDRDNVLCNYQMREYGMGVKYLSLGSNIYGWCIHDIMSSNIGGGPASITARGMTLEYCITNGCKMSESKNVEFAFYLKDLPARVQTALTEMLAVRDGSLLPST